MYNYCLYGGLSIIGEREKNQILLEKSYTNLNHNQILVNVVTLYKFSQFWGTFGSQEASYAKATSLSCKMFT
jgi:hypothetical protein